MGESRFVLRMDISIHSPYTGRDEIRSDSTVLEIVFQSTLPIQGETTYTHEELDEIRKFQSTLPIQGETDSLLEYGTKQLISIHSPYTGRDRSHRCHPTL